MKPLEIVVALLAGSVSLWTLPSWAASHAPAAPASAPALRWQAAVTLQQEGSFIALPLPPSAYAHSLSPGLADLRVVDAAGQRVPYAWLPQPEGAPRSEESLRATTAYPLPRRTAPDAALQSPVEVLVQGDRLRVRRLGGGDTLARPDAMSPGWLFDLGERTPGEAAPQRLRLTWSGPSEFAATFDIDASETLRDWRGAGSGQVMALSAPSGALQQRDVLLPADVPRFVRLVWRDTSTAPQLTGGQAVRIQTGLGAQTVTETLRFTPSPEPAGRWPLVPNSLHFDLGGGLPIHAVDLQLPPATRVVPLRLQGRQRSDEPWRELGSWVAYRLDRPDGQSPTSHSPPMAVPATVRYLRLLPDERTGALDAARTQLVVKAALATLVFASQGQPPFQLQAGADNAANGALPIGMLVPQLDQERDRLGRAQLGEWTEVTAVAEQAAADQRRAAMRVWLLWGVLLAGVIALGAMVWKLARGARHDTSAAAQPVAENTRDPQAGGSSAP
ncbi:DUF3999 domain-containing protein [Roseateles amylovorans]|uniref:DUF3999 domain-containing protein n=1 Tax=Roseateles amylovorans TaxID=2978473 RepID=A0ABY6B5B6_9BURK|nr:DUF3999 domain-containing protein [Roseateles amylovorans]UXH80365.1 DUF3999 domain-containing protein [Roseateles amylovorans]